MPHTKGISAIHLLQANRHVVDSWYTIKYHTVAIHSVIRTMAIQTVIIKTLATQSLICTLAIQTVIWTLATQSVICTSGNSERDLNFGDSECDSNHQPLGWDWEEDIWPLVHGPHYTVIVQCMKTQITHF